MVPYMKKYNNFKRRSDVTNLKKGIRRRGVTRILTGQRSKLANYLKALRSMIHYRRMVIYQLERRINK